MQQTQQQTASQQKQPKTANGGTAVNSNGVTNTSPKLATTAAGKAKTWTVQVSEKKNSLFISTF